jgi:hypothetical protein
MSRVISLIVVEGALEVSASLKMLESLKIPTKGIFPINKGGRNSFWRDVLKYNKAAATLGPVLGITDLESHPCPSGLIRKHLPRNHHSDFLLRIAERMLESWLLADSLAMARFLNISEALIPKNPDNEQHPKQVLVNLARRSPLKNIQRDIVPEAGSNGIVGKGYTPRITQFIENSWRPLDASKKSESLRRALAAINKAVQSS